MSRDQRLVQTAVMGSAESEIPVLLPMQAEQARQYRQAHAEATFWCGQWLGGCRGRLTIKVPDGKVAHFAHIPGPGRVTCRRTSVGVSGADHLFIKQQILAWLAEQNIAAAARLPEDAEQLGRELLFAPGGHGCLRVLLEPDAALPAAEEGTHLLLGPHVAHDPHQMTLNGYVLRIRCDTDGPARRVMIGTQLHGRTEWFSLDECSLTPWGLSTPAVAEIRRLRSSSRSPAAFPRRTTPARPAASVRPVAAPQAPDDRPAAFDALRKVIEDQHFTSSTLRHCLAHAEALTHGGASAEENDLLRHAADLLLAKDRGVGAPPVAAPRRGRVSRAGRTSRSPAGQAAEAVADLLDTLDRRRTHLRPGEQQRLVARLQERAGQAGSWLTRQQRRQISAWQQRTQPSAPPAAPKAAPAARIPVLPAAAVETPARPAAAPERRKRRGPGLPSVPVGADAVADAARDVLEHTARLGATITWDQLCAQVKGLAELGEEQQCRALEFASARSRSTRPLALLITTGSQTPRPHYRHLAQAGDGNGARTAWQQAVTDIHASYRPGLPPPGARPGGS
ncbi:competence protein CoiA family protein [Streptomyces sp. NPDC058371]|uniref:competence protein CoiA family protein n=1 Tax=Streptomyces sp. NPDC058371 TaxID=3346463 RepID=UPI00366222EB